MQNNEFIKHIEPKNKKLKQAEYLAVQTSKFRYYISI